MSKNMSQRQTVIWNLSILGNSAFIIDLWEVAMPITPEPLRDIKARRIIASSISIVRMIFSNQTKIRVDKHEISDISDEGLAYKQELKLRTEEGEIVVRAISIIELDGPPVLSE